MRGLLIAGSLLMLVACNKNKVTVTGTISNADGRLLRIDEVDLYSYKAFDSINLTDGGRFRFTLETPQQGFYQLRLDSGRTIVLFPEPGQRIHVQADTRDFYRSIRIEGSHPSEQAAKLVALLSFTRHRLDSLTSLYNLAEADSVQERLNLEYQDWIERHRKASIAFILTHSNSLAAVYALYQQYQPGSYLFYKTSDLQFFRIVSDSLRKYLPGSKHVIALKTHTDKLISEYNTALMLSKAKQSEMNLPELKLPGPNGDSVALSDLRGRVVLLSFWASTDAISVQQNLELKKIYNEYKKRGFEIMQVSFDRSAENWKRAIRFDELNWVHAIDKGFPESPVAGNFNVTDLPANYLISRDQSIVFGRNLTPSQLRAKLNEVTR